MNVVIFSSFDTSFEVDLPCGTLCNQVSSRTCDRVGPALSYVKVRDGEQIQHGRDVLFVLCCVFFHKDVHMCSIQCQRSNTLSMLCTVISAPRRLSRIVQCSQQP